jgi:hypothetical protein
METSQFVAGEGVRDGDQEKADAYGNQDCVEHGNPVNRAEFAAPAV